MAVDQPVTGVVQLGPDDHVAIPRHLERHDDDDDDDNDDNVDLDGVLGNGHNGLDIVELVGPVLLYDEGPVDVMREDPLSHHPEPACSENISPVWARIFKYRIGPRIV